MALSDQEAIIERMAIRLKADADRMRKREQAVIDDYKAGYTRREIEKRNMESEKFVKTIIDWYIKHFEEDETQ